MNKKIPNIGLIILLISMSIIPVSQAFNVKYSSNEELQFLEKNYSAKTSENRDTIYYAIAQIEYLKWEYGSIPYIGKHVSVWSHGPFRCFDANLEDFVLEIVMNYTAEMDFEINSNLAPIVAFGLKIDNYTDYVWKTFKLKHNGYAIHQGNITIEIEFDMDKIKSGDKFLINPIVATVGDPLVFTSKDGQVNKYTSFLLRFAYHIPSKNKYLLNKILLPFIAEHERDGIHGERTKICILFE